MGFDHISGIFNPTDVGPNYDDDEWFSDCLLEFSLRTPAVVHFVDWSEPDLIQLAHSPSLFKNAPGMTSHWDDHVLVLFWNSSECKVSALGLSDEFFSCQETAILDDPTPAVVTALRGAAGVAAVDKVGLHTAGDPGTHKAHVQCGIILPVKWAICEVKGPSALSPIAFHDRFLANVI